VGKRLALLLVVAAVVAPCAYAVTRATSPLQGNYETKLSGTPEKLLNATWKIEIAPNGNYTILRNNKVVVKGVTVWNSTKVTFTDKSGAQGVACIGNGSTGYYFYSFKKIQGHMYLVLRLNQVDPCIGRKAVLSAYPLLKL
jgi:hypothetical protein